MKKLLSGLKSWMRDLFTQPKMMAALFAGVLIAAGVQPNVAEQIGAAGASVAVAITQSNGQQSGPTAAEQQKGEQP